jgi:hypothetical protein
MGCKLAIKDGQGLTSCLSVRLHDTCRYFERHLKFPCEIDSTNQFKQYEIDQPIADRLVMYQPDKMEGIMSNGFDHGWQMAWFNELDIKSTSNLAWKICEPSKEVGIRAVHFLSKIQDRTGILYRGNDKAKEMPIASYEDMVQMAYFTGSNKFFLQTDEHEFVEYFMQYFPDTVVLNEIPRINKNPLSYVNPPMNERVEFAINFNAVLIALAMLPKVCLTNGNTSLWVALYRGHLQGVYQLHTLHNSEIRNLETNETLIN